MKNPKDKLEEYSRGFLDGVISGLGAMVLATLIAKWLGWLG